MGRLHRRLVLQSYAALLLLLLAYVLLYPVLHESGARVGLIGKILVPLLLLASLGIAVEHRRQLAGLAVLTVVLLVLDFAVSADHPPAVDVARYAVLAAFDLWVALIILRHLFRAGEVTADIILGAVCAFLLLGIAFAQAYGLVEILVPGSFRAGDDTRAVAQYFSLVTMTTLGYGDVVPVLPFARSLATVQAVVGQFYIAVVVARLVAMHATSRKAA